MSVTALLLTYNRSQFIEQALESIGNQTYTDWSLILSDCSDDEKTALETKTYFEAFKAKYPDNDCKLLRHPNRMRQAAHLNAAYDATSSTYVALMDDDDYWYPEHLSRSIEWLEQTPKNGITISNGLVVDIEGNEQGYNTNTDDAPFPAEGKPKEGLYWILRKFYGTTSGFVFRREALKRWSFPNFPCIDIHIVLGILANGYRCRAYERPSYYYRDHDLSHYDKNDDSLWVCRHQWRLWLARNHGIQLTLNCALFPLLVLKSALYLTKRRIASKDS